MEEQVFPVYLIAGFLDSGKSYFIHQPHAAALAARFPRHEITGSNHAADLGF